MSPAGLAVLSSRGSQAGCFWNNHPAHYRLRVGSQRSGWVCLPILGVKENVTFLAVSAKEKFWDGVDIPPGKAADVKRQTQGGGRKGN